MYAGVLLGNRPYAILFLVKSGVICLEVMVHEVVVVQTVALYPKCLHPTMEEHLVPWPIYSRTLISDDGLDYRENSLYANLCLRTVLYSDYFIGENFRGFVVCHTRIIR